jgi:hypothetical protein
MNERVKQLWSEAAESTIGDSWEEQTKFMERFAELIVRDCMDVVDSYTKPRTFDTHYDAVAQIEALFEIKHNRVEE